MVLYSEVLRIAAEYVMDADIMALKPRQKERLRQLSYRNWAVQECVHYICEHPYLKPSNAAKAFAFEMNSYITIAKTADASLMFAIAQGVGEDFFEILYAME